MSPYKYLLYLLLVIPQGIAFGANYNPSEVEIILDGEHSFYSIVQEAERQLEIEIITPTSPERTSKRAYHQTISLRDLINAIVQNYGQEGVPVDWKLVGNEKVVFFRKDRLPKSAVPQVKKTPTIRYQQRAEPPLLTTPSPQKKNLPKVPRWASSPKKSTNSNERMVYSDLGDDVIRSSPKPFVVSIPKKNSKSPSLSSSFENSYEESIDRLAAARTKALGITAYPEGAVAFINDAPSIVPGKAAENFLEWENRMKGAVQQNNKNILYREKRELEKRLEWLKKKLR